MRKYKEYCDICHKELIRKNEWVRNLTIIFIMRTAYGYFGDIDYSSFENDQYKICIKCNKDLKQFIKHKRNEK